ncbi:MAG: glycosyltransferase family 2 protein [Candidatus Promineifilaceae bacterium]
MNLVIILFWAAVAFVFYTYVLFPLLIFLRAALLRRPYKNTDITPEVTMIIAAHNEADAIGAKLDNVLSLDYPVERLRIIVASDGSDDGTNTIVGGYDSQGINLLALSRMGKAQALNTAVTTAAGEILVFSDANSMYATDAIRALVRPFADAEVGGVAGNQCYLSMSEGNLSGDGEKSYWGFDRKLKQLESQAGNTISATGAIYAIRRHLFQQVPDGVTDDFYTSTGVIAQGYRLVFAPDAIAYEPAAASSGREFSRKVRITTRGLHAVLVRRALLNPFRYGFYALQIFSHKVLRRMVVFPLLMLMFLNPFLWSHGLFYQLALLAQVAFYGLATLGALFKGTRLGGSKILAIPSYFCMVNLACLVAISNILRGHRIERWEPQRAESGTSGTADQIAHLAPPKERAL